VQSVKVESGLIAIFGGAVVAFPAKPWLMAQTQGRGNAQVRMRRANARGEIVVLVFRDSNGFTQRRLVRLCAPSGVPIDAQR